MSGVAGTTGRANLGTQGGAKGTQTLNLAAALKQARGLFEAGKIDEAAKLAVAILTQRPRIVCNCLTATACDPGLPKI